MKEATGELNMAVVVSFSIAILAAFFFGYLWPLIDHNFERTSQCNKAVCNCSNGIGSDGSVIGENYRHEVDGIEYCTCWPEGEDQTEENKFYCLYRG